MQHKPSWGKYALLQNMDDFNRNMMIRITKLHVSIRHFSDKTPRRSKIINLRLSKTQADFYKFLLKGVERTVYNSRYKTLRSLC